MPSPRLSALVAFASDLRGSGARATHRRPLAAPAGATRPSGHADVVMIGRRRDLVAGTGCRIFSTDDASWTPDRNRAWIADGIRRACVFVVASALTPGNLRTREHGAYRRTVFALELDQLFAAGYRRDAALLLPPNVD